MTRVQTFWCEPAEPALYRHEMILIARERRCVASAWGLCSARIVILDRTQEKRQEIPPEGDPRWPAECDRCGTSFDDADLMRSMGFDRYFAGSPDDEIRTLGEMGAGAMWDAEWMSRAGGDGISLVVRLPNGMDFMPDGPASNAPGKLPGWDRTGDPRKPETLTVRPSIGSGKAGDPGWYHGFLTDGVLVACGDSKT